MATTTDFAKVKGPICGAKAKNKTEKDLRKVNRAGSLGSTSLSPNKQKKPSQATAFYTRTSNIYNRNIKQNIQA